MSVVDVFEILFKNNAKEAAKDVDELNTKIRDLAAKGASRSDEEEKQIKELRRLRASRLQDLKDETGQVDKMSNSLMDFGLKAVAAFASFEAIKDGITNAIAFNTQLEKMHLLTGTSVTNLQGYSAAFANLGSSQAAFLEFYQKTSEQAQAVNGDVSNVLPNLLKYADLIKAKNDQTPGSGKQFFEASRVKLPGLTEDMYLALSQGSGAIKAEVERQKDISGVTPENTEEARQITKEWTDVQTEFVAAFRPLLPIAHNFVDTLSGLALGLRGLADAVAFAYDFITGHWSRAGKDSDDYFKTRSIFNNKIGADTSIFGIHVGAASVPASPGVSGSNKEQSRAFWLAQGYTPAQVAGLLANEQVESGNFQTNPVGDHGSAHGIFQWHNDRRKRILDATGIDIATASHADQLRAAAWELQARGNAAGLRGQTDAAGSAAYLVRNFEIPADIAGQSHYRGMIAANEMANFADKTPLSSAVGGGNQNTVHINQLTVNTQATDANGIAQDIHKSLNDQMVYMVANTNDGIAK